jgi:hypothetical protein
MKIKLLTILTVLLVSSLCHSQDIVNKNFLYLYSDSIVNGKTIKLKEPFLGSDYFTIDSKKISPYKVKFYKYNGQFYANTKAFSLWGSSDFYKCISKGKINLFEQEETYYSAGHFNAATGMYSGGTVTRATKQYYNKGYEDLKKANYRNLAVDLSDNPASELHLTKLRRNRNAQIVLNIVGLGSIIGGLATFPKGMSAQDQPTANLVAIGVGAGCLWVTYFIGRSKPRLIRNAINAYNH